MDKPGIEVSAQDVRQARSILATGGMPVWLRIELLTTDYRDSRLGSDSFRVELNEIDGSIEERNLNFEDLCEFLDEVLARRLSCILADRNAVREERLDQIQIRLTQLVKEGAAKIEEIAALRKEIATLRGGDLSAQKAKRT